MVGIKKDIAGWHWSSPMDENSFKIAEVKSSLEAKEST
jgi:hypothetical protein